MEESELSSIVTKEEAADFLTNVIAEALPASSLAPQKKDDDLDLIDWMCELRSSFIQKEAFKIRNKQNYYIIIS